MGVALLHPVHAPPRLFLFPTASTPPDIYARGPRGANGRVQKWWLYVTFGFSAVWHVRARNPISRPSPSSQRTCACHAWHS